MKIKRVLRGVVTLLLLVGPLQDQALHARGWTFNNTDVLDLLKKGRSDNAIVEMITGAQTATFRFEADDLLALRNAGASLGVISAMLARARKSSGNDFGAGVLAAFKSLKAETLPLISRQGQQDLGFSRGDYIREDRPLRWYLHLDFPGLRASIRTTDPKPSVLVRIDAEPGKRYFMARLAPSSTNKLRSMEVKAETRLRSFVTVLVPEKRCMIDYTATEEGKGVWRLAPKANLEPGEYGLLDGVRLFEFGIDPQEGTSSPPGESR